MSSMKLTREEAAAYGLDARGKPSKYRNKKVMVDGHEFDSKREARRYEELDLLVRAGEIDALQLQPAFNIELNGIHVCTYRADFRYWDKRLGKEVVEDVKGVKTPVYRLKKRLVEAMHFITITEV